MAKETIVLQAYATSVAESQKKISIAISLLKLLESDFSLKKETTVYILPDEQSKFINSIADIFNASNTPTNINKSKYEQTIVNYTINLSLNNLDYEKLNEYYTVTLGLDDTLGAFEGNNSALQESLDYLNKLKEDNLSLYEASKQIAPGVDAAHSNKEIEEDIDSGPFSDYQTPKESNKSLSKALFGDKLKTETKRPVVQMDGMPTAENDLFANLPKESTNALKGIGGSRLIEPVPAPIYYPGDSYLASENNSGIICSRDEIYRFRGHTKSGAVYMYAGMSAENIEPVEYSEDTDEQELINRQPISLVSDSSYVYVSQKADVDSLFFEGVAGGTYSKAVKPFLKKGNSETRKGLSLVAMKADDVLIMSRASGIRLVTGTDKNNTRGGRQYAKYGIDLIAGNDDTDLQPLVKGDNLIVYLKNLSNVVSKLRAIVFEHITSQTKFNAAMQKHSHYDPFLIFLATASTQGANPLAINGGKGLVSDEAVFAGASVLAEALALQVKAKKTAITRVNNDGNAFSKLGSYSILSEKNRTN